MNEPCERHRRMDALSGSLGMCTVRCAHVGSEYIHERIWPEAGSRWLNRSTEHGLIKPELESAATPAEADRVWAEMERRMLAGEPFGLPY